jgi:hypothetical protein
MTGPHTHQPGPLFQLYPLEAGECGLSYRFFSIGIIGNRQRPGERLEIAEPDLDGDRPRLIPIMGAMVLRTSLTRSEAAEYAR